MWAPEDFNESNFPDWILDSEFWILDGAFRKIEMIGGKGGVMGSGSLREPPLLFSLGGVNT